jgi:vancomycin resistance protein YoaR
MVGCGELIVTDTLQSSRLAGRVLLALGLPIAAVLVFAAATLAGLELSGSDRILPGVRVLGVPLGGLTRDEAAATLSPRSAAILDQSIELHAGTRQWTTSPRALGAKLDPVELATAAYDVGHSGPTLSRMRDQLRTLQAETDVPITSTADGAAVDLLLARIAADIDRAPRAAVLDLADDGAITFVTSETGEAFDQSNARTLVNAALMEGRPSVELPTRALPPAIATQQVADAHQQLVRMLDDTTPIQLSAADQTWTVDHSELLSMVTLNPAGPTSPASVELKDEPLQTIVQRAAHAVDQDPQDARFTLSNGQLSVLRPSHEGRAVNQQAALDLLKTRIEAGERTVAMPVDVVRPAVASEDAPKLGIRELIDESSTAFVGAIPEKAHNIQLAAARLNGVVVPPGGTFSFNKEVGPTTLEAGFQWGFGLTTGGASGSVHTVPSVAGGICQVATTLFQPVFWAGYQLEERFWHLYWIPSYASRGLVGLDATVDSDASLDLKWINPTADPVLIQASANADHVTFRLYGQKPPWTVQVDEPVISNRITADPTPDVQPEPSMAWGRVLAVESARDGFDVVLDRHVTPTDGRPARELLLKSVYAPAHTVTLVGTNGAPDPGSVSAAVERVLQSLQPAAAPAPTRTDAAPSTYPTPNGPRTLAQIRDELSRAGWGGGSDQDALETYNRVASGH